jgi:hypothetical protein
MHEEAVTIFQCPAFPAGYLRGGFKGMEDILYRRLPVFESFHTNK